METKRQKTAALWKACFDDTDEYIQFYFDRKYRDENTLLHEENGQAIAALQMLPYPMNWAGTTLRASYISGACTLPEARNRGIMTRLLAEAFLTMARRSIDLTFLIPAEPWLYGYYGKTGYAPVFEYTPETFTPAVPTPTTATLDIPAAYSDTLANSCYPYFDREMQKRPDSIQHPFDDFSTVLRDLYASGGRLLVAKSKEDSSGLTGLAFALPEENHVRISELLGNTPEIRAQLLHAASRLGNGKPSPANFRHNREKARNGEWRASFRPKKCSPGLPPAIRRPISPCNSPTPCFPPTMATTPSSGAIAVNI